MPTQEEVMQHKDAGKYGGEAAEKAAKKVGLGKFSSKIGSIVRKFIEKKQKATAAAKDKTKSKDVSAEPTAAEGAPAEETAVASKEPAVTAEIAEPAAAPPPATQVAPAAA